MKLFKKLAINIHSRVEAMADQMENKEALSAAYIREYERTAAKAKVRSGQAASQVARLEKEAARLAEQEALWAGRARKVHSVDEAKALECVARMKQAQAAHGQVLGDLEEARCLKRKMAADVDHILKKVEALRRRHQNLAGRQVCAEAFNALQRVDSDIQDDMDDLFARWETDVVAHELHAQSADTAGDPLAETFAAAEQKEELRVALKQILAVPERPKEKK